MPLAVSSLCHVVKSHLDVQAFQVLKFSNYILCTLSSSTVRYKNTASGKISILLHRLSYSVRINM